MAKRAKIELFHLTGKNGKTVCGKPIEVKGRLQVLIVADPEKTKNPVCKKCLSLSKPKPEAPPVKTEEKKVKAEKKANGLTWPAAVKEALEKAGGKKVPVQTIWTNLKTLIPEKIEKLEKGKNPSNAYRSMIMVLMKNHERVERGVWSAK